MSVDLVVPPTCPSMRLDQFVASQLPGASRRRLRDVDLRVNGRPAKNATLVRPGDVVSVPESLVAAPELCPNPDLAVAILHQDDALVAVDKPAGMQSVALRAEETDTLANFLVAAFPEVRGFGDPLEGGLAHRLDAETSGILLAARTSPAHAELRRQFAAHEVRKEYLALVTGDVSTPGHVDAPIAHDRRRPARMRPCEDAPTAERLRARPALTNYVPVLRYGRETLLRVRMRTGVRHQVRVHLATIGHPIVGDALYGGAERHRWITRQALHASRVELRHPSTGETLALDCALPADFEAALRRLKP